MVKDNTMDSSSSHPPENPKRLKTLASSVKFPGGNALLHQFVLDNSHPNESGSVLYLNAVLLSMSDVPASVVNALNDEGYSAFHLAVLKNNLLVVEKLLSFLVNIDANVICRRKGNYLYCENTALHLAAELGHLSIIRTLVDNGVGIDIKDEDRDTALCYAMRSGHLDVMKWLVSQGADVNLRCGYSSPLCHAAYRGNLEAVQFLVSSGADINFRLQMTPLCMAAASNNLATVEFLVSNGADVNMKPYNVDGIEDETPLHHAALKPGLEILEYLVRKGADVNAEDGRGRTPLHYAAICGKSGNAAFLSDQGANINAKNERNETPLHLAVKKRNSVIYKFFKSSGVWVRHDVVSEGNLEIAKLLIEQGADLRAIDENGKTPLHDAVYDEVCKMEAFLSGRGEGPNADRGWNLHYDAYYRECAKCIRTLLDRGADVNDENTDGETPLDLARNQQCMDALRDARERGGSRPDVSHLDGYFL